MYSYTLLLGAGVCEGAREYVCVCVPNLTFDRLLCVAADETICPTTCTVILYVCAYSTELDYLENSANRSGLNVANRIWTTTDARAISSNRAA